MAKNLSSVLCVGSSKLTVITGANGTNKNFIVYGKSEMPYSGFSDGEFFEPDLIEKQVGKAIEEVELASNFSIKELTISVPSEFLFSECKKINASFPKKQKVTSDVLEEIYQNSFGEVENHTLISTQPIYNILDNGKKVIDALGGKTTKITSYLNFVYARNDFIKLFNTALANLGVVRSSFAPEPTVVNEFLFNETASEVCLIDVGYLTTSISVYKGRGLTHLNSFSLGGAHIMADLMNGFNLTAGEAEDLKRKVILTLQTNSNGEMYETSTPCKSRKIFVRVANEVVKERIESIAFCVNSCLKKYEDGDRFPLYLTGGGLALVKGAKEYLSSLLGRDVKILSPNIAQFNRPDATAEVALLSNTLKQKEKHRFLVAKEF